MGIGNSDVGDGNVVIFGRCKRVVNREREDRRRTYCPSKSEKIKVDPNGCGGWGCGWGVDQSQKRIGLLSVLQSLWQARWAFLLFW